MIYVFSSTCISSVIFSKFFLWLGLWLCPWTPLTSHRYPYVTSSKKILATPMVLTLLGELNKNKQHYYNKKA